MVNSPYLAPRQSASAPQGLADVLERVLNTGIVIAGDIQVNLLDIELLTIKIRLLVASADTAQQMGIDWWQHDKFLSSDALSVRDRSDGGDDDLRARLERIEQALAQLGAGDAEPAQGQVSGDQGHER